MKQYLKAFSLVCILIMLTSCMKRYQTSGRGPASSNGGFPRETGRSFLVKNQAEAEGYGLYSYILFGSPPSSATRERYLRTIAAYLEIPPITSLEEYLPHPSRLNITYLPLDTLPQPKVQAEWVLEHYNYARARVLLRSLPGNHRDGPYIVSLLKPLSGVEELSGQYLHQDLSAVPPHIVLSWVKEFLNQAAKERFWEKRTAEQLVLKLREAIAIIAFGLPDVQKALDIWIAWIH